MKLIKVTCPNCEANLTIDADNRKGYCQYCGTQIMLDDGKTEHTYNKNVNIHNETINRHIDDADVIRAKTADHEEKNAWKFFKWYFIVFGVVIVLGLTIPPILAHMNTVQGKISAGDYDEYVGENYEAVVAQFEILGFENITTVDLNDSGLAFWMDKTVESISINGKTEFYDYDYFEPDAKVIIKYH